MTKEQDRELTPHELLAEEVNKLRKELHVITKRQGFKWSLAIRRGRGWLLRPPMPVIELSEWVLGKDGVVYIAAPDASMYVPVDPATMSMDRLGQLKDALETTLTRYTGVG